MIISFADKPAAKLALAWQSAEQSKFGEVELSSDRRVVEINAGQFVRCVSNALERRLLPEHDVPLLKDLSVLEPAKWPIEPNVRYGEEEINGLCSRFRIDNNAAIRGLREFIDKKDSYADTSRSIKGTCKSGEDFASEHGRGFNEYSMQRGFNALNEVITSKRSKLLVKNVSSLLFLKINGPPLGSFNPTAFVRTWSVSGHREAMDTRSRSCNAVKFGRMTDSSKKCLWNIFDE